MLDWLKVSCMLCISSTAMNIFKRFSLSSCFALSLLALASTQVGCDSSSSDSQATVTGVWSMSAAQFASGMYAFSMKSNHGPDIVIAPDAGGTTGNIRAAGMNVPVTFVYTPDVAGDGGADFPSSASLEVTFVEPGAPSMESFLKALGVTLAKNEAGETETVPAGSMVTFFYAFTPYTSVRPVVFARPSAELDEVHASWQAFDSLPVEQQTVGSWMLLDMLQTDFDIFSSAGE